mmetsp:Transcript_17661/g.24240  ORF Transcript_17661/g.24240 Transcript_17661/m.24240 type:complete len:120 (-) Transcript_17661:1049-1408(-)
MDNSDGGSRVTPNNRDTLEFEDLFKRRTWENFFFHTPCVRSSYLWGIGCGSIMMAHKLRLYRNFHHGFSAAILTFTFVSSLSFLKCAHDVNTKYELLRKAFAVQNIKEIKRDVTKSSNP